MKPEAQTESTTGESSPPVSRYLPNGLWVPPEANVTQEDANAPHPEGWTQPMGVSPQNWQENGPNNANMEGENATEGSNNGNSGPNAPPHMNAPGQGPAMLVGNQGPNGPNAPNAPNAPNMAGAPMGVVAGGSPTCQMQMPVMNPMMGNQMGVPMQGVLSGGQVMVQGPQGQMAIQMDPQQMQMLQQGGPTIVQTPEGQMQMQMQVMQPMPQPGLQPPTNANPNNTSSDSGSGNNALATPNNNNNSANNSGLGAPAGDSPSLTQPQRLFGEEGGNGNGNQAPNAVLALPGLNGANKPPSPIDPLKFKTKICRNFSKNGMCSYESSCCFAHGEHELREPINVQGSPTAMPISPLNPNFVKRSNEHLEAQQQMQQMQQQDGGSPGAVPNMQPNSPQQPQQAMLMQLGRMPDGSMVCMPLNSNPGVQMQVQMPMGGSPQAPMGNPGMVQGVVHPPSPVGPTGSPQQMQMGGPTMMMVQQPMHGAPNGVMMGPNQPLMQPNGNNGPNGPQMATGPQGQVMQIGAYQQVPMQMQVPMGGVRHPPSQQQSGQTSPLPQQQA